MAASAAGPGSQPRYWLNWLPSDVVADAEQEPARFHALKEAFCAAAAAAKDEPATAYAALMPYIPPLNNLIDTHRAFPLDDVVPLAQALLGVVLSSSHDLELQVRVAQTLTELLQQHKRELSRSPGASEVPSVGEGGRQDEGDGPLALVLPWRPLLELLLNVCSSPPPRLEGIALNQARAVALFKLAAKARRYFEPDAVFEVWRLLQPTIASVANTLPEAYEAVGWLTLCSPTYNIGRCDHEAVNRLVGSWLDAMQRLHASPSWTSLWLGLLARVAKDDWKGIIDWSPHLDVLFTTFIGMFSVPVGAADSAIAVSRPAPSKTVILHLKQMVGEHAAAGQLAVSLLRTCPQRPHTAHVSAGAMSRLHHLAGLLDNYLHPSNTGKWSRELAAWLKALANTFLKQCGKQGPDPLPWAAALHAPTRTAFVELAARLSARAQFSKDEVLSKTAVAVLGGLAYVGPGQVLPLVVSRFRDALESSTATHTLASAISALARCVRPLLLSGWAGVEEESGPQVIAEAMMALLPGIDTNDEAKTSAVMHLYTVVLSCTPMLQGAGSDASGASSIPVYVEEWAEEVVVRLCTLLSNLDPGPGHRADGAAGRGGPNGSSGVGGGSGAASFLTSSTSFFPHLVSLLLSRTPLEVASSLARRISRFAVSETLPGMERALGVMIGSAATHHPEVVVADAIRPLMSRLERELGGLGSGAGSGGSSAPSPALEATLGYLIGVLREAAWSLRADVLLPLAPQLLTLADTGFEVGSRPVQDACSSLLSALVCVLGRTISDPYTPCKVVAAGGGAGLGPHVGPGQCEEWVDKEGANNIPPPRWVPPSPQASAWVEGVVQSHLVAPAQHMATLLLGGAASPSGGELTGHALRMALHAVLVRMKGVLAGLLSTLRDYEWAWADAAGGTRVRLAGAQGPALGAPGTRETVSAALAAVSGSVFHMDAETVGEYLAVLGLVLCSGTIEYSAVSSMRDGESKVINLVAEPAAAGLLLPSNDSSGSAVRPWRKRVPRWAALLRVNQVLVWRCSQNAFRSWATASMPDVPSAAALPTPFLALTGVLCKFSTHPLSAVRMEAYPLLNATVKRFPVLARGTVPHFFAALADLPPPDTLPLAVAKAQQAAGAIASAPAVEAVVATCDQDEVLLSFHVRLAEAAEAAPAATPPAGPSPAALKAAASGSGSSAEAGAAAVGAAAATAKAGVSSVVSVTQAERDGAVEGAVRALTGCLSLWRLIFRDTSTFCGMINAILASRAHNSTVAQGSISNLLINFSSRFFIPPTMSVTSPHYTQLAQRILHLSHPNTLRASWRYSLTANVMAVMLMPSPKTGPAVLPFLRHMLSLLSTSTMLPLRQMAAGGLMLLLSCVLEYGERNAELEAEVVAWLGQEGTGAALVKHLASDHAALDAAEASTDKRGAGLMALQSRLLNMTHEELMLKVVRASVDTLQRWPEGGTVEWQPEAVRNGLFVVSHARLIALLGVLAPEVTLRVLRAPLEAAVNIAETQQITNVSDKADQAAAAEAMAGLLASGAPFHSGSPEAAANASWATQLLARQLQHASLELSEAWSVTTRFAVHGLMDVVFPPAIGLAYLLADSPSAQSVQHLSAAEAMTGLGHLLQTVLATGPSLASISAAAAEGTHLPIQIKRLRYAHQCCRELASYSPSRELPPQVRIFWGSMLSELRSALMHDVFSLRKQLGRTLGMLLTYFGVTQGDVPDGPQSPVDGSPIKVTAGEVGDDVEMAELPGENGSKRPDGSNGGAVMVVVAPTAAQLEEAAGQLAVELLAAANAVSEEVQCMRTAGGSESGGSGSTGTDAGGEAVAVGLPGSSGSHSSLESEPVMVDRPASPEPMDADEEGPEAAAAVGPGAMPPSTRLMLSRLGLVVSFVGWAAFHGDLLRLRGVMLGLLSHLFRLQELAGPVLQTLDHESKMAAALSKYVVQSGVVGRSGVTHVLRAIEVAASGSVPGTASMVFAPAGAAGDLLTGAALRQDVWSTRAAALTYSQYFWFRSCFLLAPAESARLQELVLSRLCDPKPEVRAIAGATLSGMLRGMAEGEAGALRARLVGQSRALFARPRKDAAAAAGAGTGAASGANARLLEKHGVVQGLKAFLQSAPYDCPPWMPQVLMALVAPASAVHAGVEAAVRSAASKALSDFKRTHEQDSLQVLRAMMSSDDYETLQQCTSSASYFC